MAVVGVAWAGEETATITIGSFTDLPTGSASYNTYSWTQGGISGRATIYANQNSTSMQFNASNNLFYSTSAAPGTIKSVKLTTASGTNRTYEVYGSTTAYTGSGTSYGTQIGSQTVTTSGTTYTVSSGDYTYFTVVKTGSGAGYLASVEVTYETTGGSTAVATTVTIDDSDITNTDVYTGTAAGSLTATVTETESGNSVSGATVTWTSSKENVATIDENGVVTLVAAGTTTITATYAGVSGEFGSSSATYELTVTSSAPYEQPTTIEITPNYEFWGQTAQFSGSTYDNLSGEKDNVTLEWSRGSGSTYANTTAMRFYKDNTLTFTAPDGYEIKSIEILLSTTATTSNDLTFSPDGYNSQTTTWTGSSATVTMSRPSDGTSYFTITKYTITLGLPSTDPIINASDVNIAYDATSGEIAYTINNPVPGTLLQATADADWVSDITVGDEAITFTTTANELKTERVATFTLTYEGAEDKTVTVTQAGNPNIIDKIENISESGVPYNVQGTVVATSARAFVIGDGTGYIYYYNGNTAPSVSVGDMVKISGTTSSYNQVIQFPNSATITVATESEYTPLTPAAMTEVPDYTSGLYKSDYYQFEGMLTKEGNYYVVAVGEGQIRISYPSTSQTTELDALLNKMVKVNGFFAGNSANGSGVFTAIMESIEEVVSDEPSITLASYEVEVNANAHTTPTTIAVTYANIDFENDVPEVVFYESDGSTETTYDWLFVDLDADWNVYYTIEENTNNAARTAYFKVLGYDSNGNNVYSNLASITQHEFEPDYADLPYDFNGGKADIENENGLTQNGLGSDYSGNNPKLRFDNAGDYLVLKINPSQFPKAITFNIKGNGFSGGTFSVQVSEDGETYTDLAAYTDSEITSSNQTFTLLNTNDNVRYIRWNYIYRNNGNVGIGNIYVDDEYKVRGNATVSEDLTLDKCTIQESGKLTIKSGTLNVTNALTNEATSEAWNNLIIEDGGQLKISNSVNGTVLKNITGYSSYTGTGNGGYYLIATPATLDATGQTNMFPSVQSDHQYVDFYGFDQTMVAEEWRNYKYGSAIFAGPLGMEQGQGYLYASKDDVTLTLKTIGLSGMINNSYVHTDYPFVPTNADKIVEVSYNAEGINEQEVVFKGYNLIGNPFTCKAYLADGRDFYRMNEVGDKIVVATDKAINVAEGIFVIAESGETNVTFTTTDPTVTSTGGVLNITLSQAQSNRGNAATIDAARIRFGEGRMLPKFNFMGNNGGISIPQGSKDYAVVRSQGEGELPVNFKADKNGAYTLSIRPENVEMDYLHLIDNLTGTEVDLLATPSYTFNAKKTDYASRFRLVFSTTGVEENGTEANANFAYFNGSEWVVNASDNATLEVIDMMGRTVLCKDVARNVSTNGWAQGVYVIRLTDNNSVKTQKIVVR